MSREKIELLKEELLGLQMAAGHLGYSMESCRDLTAHDVLPTEQLVRRESLAGHFARFVDLLIQRILRLIDEIESVILKYPK